MDQHQWTRWRELPETQEFFNMLARDGAVKAMGLACDEVEIDDPQRVFRQLAQARAVVRYARTLIEMDFDDHKAALASLDESEEHYGLKRESHD